jgi:anti-anti-sigma factor
MALTATAETARGAGFAVAVSGEGTATVVALRGEGERATVPVLVNALAHVIADKRGAVIVDLSQTAFFDTGSVRVTGRADQCLADRGRQLTIRSASRQAVMVLAAFGLSHLLETDDMPAPERPDFMSAAERLTSQRRAIHDEVAHHGDPIAGTANRAAYTSRRPGRPGRDVPMRSSSPCGAATVTFDIDDRCDTCQTIAPATGSG